MTTATFETYEQNRARVLSRWSVLDLFEQTDDDLDRGDEMFRRGDDLEILGQGRTEMIDWWCIRSGSTVYQCRRFKNFVYCCCRDFFHRHKMCKHLALTTGVKCERCGELRAIKGKYCFDCDQVVNRFNKPKPQGINI